MVQITKNKIAQYLKKYQSEGIEHLVSLKTQ